MSPGRNLHRTCPPLVSSTPRTFQQFARLPIEIRLMVWRATFPKDKSNTTLVFELEEGMRACMRDRHYKCSPVSLYINQESRNETLKYYRRFYHTNANTSGYMLFHESLHIAYIYKDIRTIVFNPGDWWTTKQAMGDLGSLLKEFLILFPDMKQSVRTLELNPVQFHDEYNQWLSDHGEGAYHQGSDFLGQLVPQFPNMTRLVLQEDCFDQWGSLCVPIGKKRDWARRIKRVLQRCVPQITGRFPKIILKKSKLSLSHITSDMEDSHIHTTMDLDEKLKEWEEFWAKKY